MIGRRKWAAPEAAELSEDIAAEIDRHVARRIRQRRRQLGMTQQQLARIIGVAFQQAYKYEHGISRVSAGRLFHIARALRAPIAYFFSGERRRAPADAAPAAGGERAE